MRISVFGGSNPKENEPVYQQALQLGKMLAEKDHTVLTGGYIGIMEAVSRGAAEAGGHVIGVTCDEIEKWRPLHANPWVKEEWHVLTLRERLWCLLEKCDLAIAMPGGAGTMAEISMLWNHLIIGAIPPKPIIIVGESWREVFEVFFRTLGNYTSDHDRHHLVFVKSVSEAINKIGTTNNVK
jgi:uncharacterized protein (TIGR00730 family)